MNIKNSEKHVIIEDGEVVLTLDKKERISIISEGNLLSITSDSILYERVGEHFAITSKVSNKKDEIVTPLEEMKQAVNSVLKNEIPKIPKLEPGVSIKSIIS